MMILALSAASVGLFHSLSPGHWLPVVLMAKSRKWSLKTSIFGALVAASGHILLSILLAVASIFIEFRFLSDYENEIERYAGLALVALGIFYAGIALFTHHRCHGHSHHGIGSRKNKKAPFLFLFSLGLSPCVAVIPVVAKAAVQGSLITIFTLIAFACGVLLALIGATLLVSMGLIKLDHPVFEHYGDVVAGCGVALMGCILFFASS